ncbi:complement C1q tumor necrosis factor-related protein 4-like [Mya arenaria]|uniref:complement C1q tumor necrosis factor-related protein 4-like n=1 Tax=Mya arenaria TaxID=6604 RepID=UPI0022E3EC45|nr:complement C1q tumor necrosis factor-related protein 4-like [Mya arenaria]
MFRFITFIIVLFLQIINHTVYAKEIQIDETNGLIIELQKVIYDIKGRVNSLETEVVNLRHENNEQQELIGQLRNEIDIQGKSLNREIKEETNPSITNSGFNTSDASVPSDVNIANVFPLHPLPRSRRAVANIAFSAYLTHTQSHQTNTAVRFDKVLLNDGNGYNAFTGAFTAPLSGVYMFSFHFDSHTLSFLQLAINGVNQVDAVANRHVLNDFNDRKAQSMGGNTCIVHVDHGQAVQVRVYEIPDAEVASSNTFRLSTFSGVLLY